MKILIAEDNAFSRTLLKKTLNKAGYDAIATESGEAAWHLQRGVDLARETHLAEYEFLAQQSLAELQIRTGDLDEVETLLQAMPPLLEAIGTEMLDSDPIAINLSEFIAEV